MEDFYKDLIKKIKDRKRLSGRQLSKLKRDLAKKHSVEKPPKNIDILLHAKQKDLRNLKEKLLTKPTRTISGVSPVAIMTKPKKCPHGKCTYCPGGPKSHFGDVPQSYTGEEPATLRAKRNQYDPYRQIFNRLEQFIVLGHLINKIELIVMGGTFPSYSKQYQNSFISYAFKAMNDFSLIFFKNGEIDFKRFKDFFLLPGDIHSKKRAKEIRKRVKVLKKLDLNKKLVDKLFKNNFKDKKSNFRPSLEDEQKRNEDAHVGCIALCIETRPDYCKEEHIEQMLKLGTTRIELGVQHFDDKVLKKIERGHTVKDSVEATRLAKNAFLKVGYHIMPGLPNSTLKDDKRIMYDLFNDTRFKPDALKIYPCLVAPGTKLYEQYKKKEFKPLDTEKASKLIANFKKEVPRYCRIMRVQRDIPTKQIIAGVDITNLRQHIHHSHKIDCQCIRCREPRNRDLSWRKIRLRKLTYKASQGLEFFLSFDDVKHNILLGFCRLRINDTPVAGIRELHVYGAPAKLGQKGCIQHKGFGKQLVKKAEEIAKQNGRKKMKVISGVGVRNYYRKIGYKKEGHYMVKDL